MDAALLIIAAHEDQVAPLVIAALRSTSRRLYLYFSGKKPSVMLGIAPSLRLQTSCSLSRGLHVKLMKEHHSCLRRTISSP